MTTQDDETPEGAQTLKDRLTRQSEDALGKVAQELLENGFVSAAVSRAFDARERALQAQEAAMGALNIPSAADIERLTRRLRSVSQRLEGIEDAVERLGDRLDSVGQAGGASQSGRLEAIEGLLAKLVADTSNIAEHLNLSPSAHPREQERMRVEGHDTVGDSAGSAEPGQQSTQQALESDEPGQ